ncbi:cyclin-dependent kinase 2-interacting protein isoform X2 [Seriola aureovittata]|uniref:cyclin-dependent kinase 2-interacting protein isoform X2 n=1 Tax=Seriola aureovittata TaxID=2871759 RepID=UPI0024BE9BE0|nr:cyclin-dependent kinase 2-interacting protein isoform X2 [Seriola aureovittata]
MDGVSGDIMVTSTNRKCSAVTGSARKIKDNAADWHNLILSSQNSQLQLVDQSSSPSSPSSASAAPAAPAVGAAELQDECCKLQDVVDKMVTVVKKMEQLMTSQRGIQDLEEFQFGPEGRKCPLFHTWNTKQFKLLSGVLWEAFSQELKLKQTILQELAHTETSDLCMVYLSCWLHQPFIPPQIRLTLESVLLETGHRPL